jgi:hypothetical protein
MVLIPLERLQTSPIPLLARGALSFRHLHPRRGFQFNLVEPGQLSSGIDRLPVTGVGTGEPSEVTDVS